MTYICVFYVLIYFHIWLLFIQMKFKYTFFNLSPYNLYINSEIANFSDISRRHNLRGQGGPGGYMNILYLDYIFGILDEKITFLVKIANKILFPIFINVLIKLMNFAPIVMISLLIAAQWYRNIFYLFYFFCLYGTHSWKRLFLHSGHHFPLPTQL